MVIWIDWLAPVAMLLMLSAQPVMRTLSVALGAWLTWAPADTASAIRLTRTTATRLFVIVLLLESSAQNRSVKPATGPWVSVSQVKRPAPSPSTYLMSSHR